MYDLQGPYFLYATAQALIEDRRAQAEKESLIHRAHLQTRAATRLHRAVALARRDGLDRSSVTRELADLLSDRTRN